MAESYLNTNEIALEELKAKELNENTNRSTKFLLRECWRENTMLTLRIIQFCHANNKQVITYTNSELQ
jgi:hypothetical protein